MRLVIMWFICFGGSSPELHSIKFQKLIRSEALQIYLCNLWIAIIPNSWDNNSSLSWLRWAPQTRHIIQTPYLRPSNSSLASLEQFSVKSHSGSPLANLLVIRLACWFGFSVVTLSKIKWGIMSGGFIPAQSPRQNAFSKQSQEVLLRWDGMKSELHTTRKRSQSKCHSHSKHTKGRRRRYGGECGRER